jgi:hypothetical protein
VRISSLSTPRSLYRVSDLRSLIDSDTWAQYNGRGSAWGEGT